MTYVYSSGFLSNKSVTSPFRIYRLHGDPLPIERADCRQTAQENIKGCIAFNHRFASLPQTEGFASVAHGHDPEFNRSFATVHLEWNHPYEHLGPVLLNDQRQFDRLYGFRGVFGTGLCTGGLWAFRGGGGASDTGLLWREASSESCVFSDDAALINDFARARALTMQAALLASNAVMLRKVTTQGFCRVWTRTWRGQELNREEVCYPGSDWYEWSSAASLGAVDQSFASSPSAR